MTMIVRLKDSGELTVARHWQPSIRYSNTRVSRKHPDRVYGDDQNDKMKHIKNKISFHTTNIEVSGIYLSLKRVPISSSVLTGACEAVICIFKVSGLEVGALQVKFTQT